jgi:hypothetical protein
VTTPDATIEPSRGVFDDVRRYFLQRPRIYTLLHLETKEERRDYTQRIAQRVGIDVTQYSVLNIHRIGIEAPVRYVFEEILSWQGDSPCWPNHVATFEAMDPESQNVRVVLFGGRNPVSGWVRRLLGPRFGTLFNMHALRVQTVPGDSDHDNARYLLWECSGGYPIGIFFIYVRSAIPERQESEQTQVFFAVGFNPHGRRIMSRVRPVRRSESGFQLVRDGSAMQTAPRWLRQFR